METTTTNLKEFIGKTVVRVMTLKRSTVRRRVTLLAISGTTATVKEWDTHPYSCPVSELDPNGKTANWTTVKGVKIATTKKPKRRVSRMSTRGLELRNKLQDLNHEITRERPYCEICILLGISFIEPRKTGHHIIPRSLRKDLVLDKNNILSSCDFCHRVVHDKVNLALLLGFLGLVNDKLPGLEQKRRAAMENNPNECRQFRKFREEFKVAMTGVETK